MTSRAVALSILASLATSTLSFADIQPGNCARAANYSENKRGFSMLVIQNGRTVFEHYANGGSADARCKIFSGTKSFWGVAALCAVRDGLIKLDDRVADTITEWKNDPRKSQITVRQLLNQTDGIEPAPHLHSESIRDRNSAAVQLPLVAAPGSVFAYGPSHLQIFAEVLRRKLNGRSTISYLEETVLSPLSLTSLDFKRDGRGNPLPATGFELSAREWARLGELVLGHGNYHGKQIVPASLLGQALTGSGANPSYGLTFWLNRQAPNAREIDYEKELDLKWQRARWTGICICRAAPPDMVVALGSNYERLFIIPSMNTIIVRQGWSEKFSDGQFLRLVLGR
ncbi:MAG TPA: serine hydrolase [Chthoniobacterales bacterium]|jgi:CubicO group peptidase (beta-lactamase class C family)|nr:serine hydrolase [Chthoniobacterales bacterium]